MRRLYTRADVTRDKPKDNQRSWGSRKALVMHANGVIGTFDQVCICVGVRRKWDCPTSQYTHLFLRFEMSRGW